MLNGRMVLANGMPTLFRISARFVIPYPEWRILPYASAFSTQLVVPC